ncbi:MAG: flippase [Dehalococcoidales bacterium]|nr:flippase [Dehalococcoidales bacterium]
MVSSYQKSGRDTIFIAIATVVQFVIGLVQLPLLTKTLGAHDYGLWSQLNATVSLVLPFTALGLGGAMIRFLAGEKDRDKIQESFYSVVAMSFLINLTTAVVIGFGLTDIIAVNFFDGAVEMVKITGILILLSPLVALYHNLIRTFRQIKRLSIFMIAEGCGQLGLIAYLVLNGHGVTSVALASVAVKLVTLIILFFLIKSEVGIIRPRFSPIKEYLSYSIPLIPRSIAFWLVNLSDRYVIGFFLGAAPVGIYSAAYSIGSLPYSVATVLTFVLLATLSKLYDEGRMDEVKNHLSYSLKYLLAIVIPFVFGAAIIGESVLRLFSTDEIASQGRLIIPLVALAVSFLSVHNIVSYNLLLAKKTKILGITWAIAAGLNIGLNILVVPRLGILGAAITTLIAYSLAFGVISYFAFREFRFPIDRRFIGKSLIASAVMSLAIWQMAPQGNLDTVVTVLAGAAIYGGILIASKGFSKTELRFFLGLLRRKNSTEPNSGEDTTL